jgi:hypothetical protein
VGCALATWLLLLVCQLQAIVKLQHLIVCALQMSAGCNHNCGYHQWLVRSGGQRATTRYMQQQTTVLTNVIVNLQHGSQPPTLVNLS